jgi:hypothetical protein
MQSQNWIPLVAEWQKAMTEATDTMATRLSVQDGEPRATGEPGTLVAVYVNSFRYVSPGARFAVGVFTGNAHINSTVRFMDLKTGELMGERSYSSASRGIQGVFAPMTDRQVRAMANQIVAEIKSRP